MYVLRHHSLFLSSIMKKAGIQALAPASKQPTLLQFFSNKSKSPEKQSKRKRSPDKKSPLKENKLVCNKNLDFDHFLNDDSFFDQLNLVDINLKKLAKYKIESCTPVNGDIKLEIVGLVDDSRGLCTLKSPWASSALKPGDIVSLRGNETDIGWVVDWNGIMVKDPDYLISGTSIVGSLWCTRKTILSEFFDEIGPQESKHMVVGCIVHELLQESLRRKYSSETDIKKLYEEIINSKQFTVRIFMEKMDYANTLESVSSYLPQIYSFINRYVNYSKQAKSVEDENWSGEIVNVKDIEEVVWSPLLGIKGKIDATVQVKVNNSIKIMPLELKTGKVSFSLEHRGQVILYCMMLKQLGEFVDSGLLLYLKGEVGIKEVVATEREIRDLTILRNGLTSCISKANEIIPSNNIEPFSVPDPINRKHCMSCGHLIACTSLLRLKGLSDLPDNNVLKAATPKVTSHLTDEHLRYIYHMVGLQNLENSSIKGSSSRIWTTDTKTREEKNWCLTNMKVETSNAVKNGNFEIYFVKNNTSLIKEIFEAGQPLVVSNEKKLAIALGFVKSVTPFGVTVTLDRNLKSIGGVFVLDSYESQTIRSTLLSNIGLLLDDNPKINSMRNTIIDLKVPKFKAKLSSKIKTVGRDIFKSLNDEQIRSVLQAVSSEEYILIKGMPGTGKTTTVRALIELFVRLGQRVLVSSHTHSAVDNILIGLIGKVDILRLGADRRIHKSLINVSESALVDNIDNVTIDALEKYYKSKQVVGVTCLGAKHKWLERQAFDVCIIDEATQVTIPAILRPILLANRFILIGDPNQLPPLVINSKAKEFGLSISLFERLERPAVVSALTVQYRMNQAINDLANNFNYKGQLSCGNNDIANSVIEYETNSEWPHWKTKALSKKLNESVIVLDVGKSETNSHFNIKEIEVVVNLVNELISLGISDIGVIATYSEQVNLIKERINNVEINTVDQYQGRDKQVIIYSTCRTSKSSDFDILGDTNRLTVAITRPKRKLIIVGDVSTLNSYKNFNKLFQHVPSDNFIKISESL